MGGGSGPVYRISLRTWLVHHSGVRWCTSGDGMAKKTPGQNRTSKTRRISVTFPLDHYVELQQIAERKRVSVAWVVRDAVEAYLVGEAPLFRLRR